MAVKCPKCQSDNTDTAYFCSNCATPLPSSEEIPASPTKTLETPTEELTRGTTFAGRYEIIEELGKGGMGKVYRVEDKKIKEEVALKLIKPEIASDKKTIERFSNELKMARKIAHRNVCKMYDLGEEKGTHYITMEYVPGQDLRGLIRQTGQLTVGTAVSIAKQVCEGLTEAHRLGVIHRDLKPQNIMIDKEGNARIMDFGIARSLKAKGITRAGVMVGTPEYMSPEQVESKETDQRSDIYSLGVILYEMVTGRVPFEGDTPLSVAVKHKTESPPNPKEINTQIPEDLSHLILRCMEKDKGKRYQSAGEMRSELENIEKGIPTTEKVIPKRKPITSKEITVTFGLKKLFIPALVVIILVIATLIIMQFLPKRRAIPIAQSDKLSLAVMYFENNTGDEGLDHWRKALSELLIADLSQSKYIKVVSGDRLFNILKNMNLLDVSNYSSEDLEQVATRGGVENILRGNFSQAGDTIRINVTLQNVRTGELLGSDRVEGEGEESMFFMVDELTKIIKANFELSEKEIADDIDRYIGTISTSSPEAFKLFIEGRNLQRNGLNKESIGFYERAIAIDPEFAMALLPLAWAYSNIGYSSKSEEYMQKTFALRDKVSERESLLIQAEFFERTEETYEKVINSYERLLQDYPDDYFGNVLLGNIFNYIEEWEKSIERNEVCIQNKYRPIYPYKNQAKSFRALGLYDKAREVLEFYLNNLEDNADIHSSLADTYLYQGKYGLTHIEMNKALSQHPSFYHIARIGDAYFLEGKLNEARQEYKKLLEMDEPIAKYRGRERLGALSLLQGRFKESKEQLERGYEIANNLGEVGWKRESHLRLAYLYLESGDPKKALMESNNALSISAEWIRLSVQKLPNYYKGLSYLDMKSVNEAQAVADELRSLIEEGLNKKSIRYYYHLCGLIELEKENFSKTYEHLKKAMSLLPFQGSVNDRHALFFNSLASAYYKSEDFDKAQQEYESITKLTTGRFYYGDIYAKSFYMLGKIYEKQGNRAKAIEHYSKFLSLWKNADPGLLEVEDARKRLAGLKRE